MNNPNDDIRIPDHKVIGVLGQGGMARVFLARDEAFDRLVAVKVIDSHVAGDLQFQRRFEREAKTAGGLSHPNIVPVHRYGTTDDGRPFLTMAYLDGGSLRDRMRKRGAMTVDDALGITRQVASALLAAHSRGIIHRDLKPDNVLFQGETAYLTDFGIAKLLNAATELTGTGLNPGTVRYFSPEQAQEHPVDARSDIYALGILLYEMLTGRQPIEGDTIVQMLLRIVNMPPQPLPPQLRGLQPFMDILLAKDPADRLGSCQEVVSIIDAMLRNWTRYADVDRLTDGVVMQASGRATPASDLDADTQLGPASLAAANDLTVARVPAPAEHAGPPDDDLGLSDPGIGRPDPGGTDIDGPVLATDPAGTPVQAIDDAIVAAEPTVLRRGRASTSTATAPAGDEAPAAAAAEQRAAATAPAGGTAAARALSGRTLGLAALLALLLGGALWWLRMPAGPDATPIAGPDGGTTPAGRAAADGGPADADAASAVVARADGPVTPATPAIDAAAPSAATGYTGAEAADATSASTAPTATTLDLRVTPADAHVTLPELRQRYRPGMELQGDSVLVRIERRGFAPRVERLPLRVGANNVERTLEPASAAAASAVAAQAPAAAAQATPGTAAAGVATRDDAAPAASPARRAPGPIRRPGERFHDALASGEPGPDMVVVPAGSFRMGGSGRDETPVRNVNVQRAFAAGVHEVTFEEFDRFARATGRDLPPDQGWGRGQRPVINVSWNDARDYTAWLSAQTGQRYRLLTEAEWEYAHRAGTSGAYTFGDTLLPGRANCDGCGGTAARRSNDVGSYPPNRFGLHDTHGNVWEWVEDCYVPGYAGAPTDARARTTAGCRERVFRGGSWFFDALSMRSSKRSVFAASNRSRDLGFRVARDL